LWVDAGGPTRINALQLQAKNVTLTANPDATKAIIEKQPLSTDISLDRSIIDKNLYVGIPTGYLSLKGTTVRQNAIFDVNTGAADLSLANFDVFVWKGYRNTKMNLNGLSFRTLEVANDSGLNPSFSDSLDLLRKAQSSISAFTAYQVQLKAQGENANAERAFIAMREKIRNDDWQQWITWPLGIVDLFQEYVLGFGHSPVPPLLWSLAFIAFGVRTFRKVDHMSPRVENPSDYSGAWYSLELFLPIVDLGVAKE
jgi:hypothetical protein